MNPDPAPSARSVQSYIDETPVWPDGTRTGAVALTPMQRRIWLLATAGKFFEGLVVFMTGVALPLMSAEFQLSATGKGVLSAAVLAGILVGASALGALADHFGRKRMFLIEQVLFVLFLIAVVFSPGYLWTVACLFGMGLALGCDYPTAHLIISESIPSRRRGTLVLSAFAFQAVGALAGTAVGYAVLANLPELQAWRWMYAVVILPAMLVIVGRLFVSDSAHWLLERGRLQEAERAVSELLRRDPPYPSTVRLRPRSPALPGRDGRSGFTALFAPGTRRATWLASLPWFLQDLGTYGIGIFTPSILAATVGKPREHAHHVADLINNQVVAAKGAALLDVLLLVGIAAAVLLADRVGRIRLQVLGFIGCALGLGLAALSLEQTGTARTLLLFGGFMLFNFMTNLGPNAQTYLIAGEVFPTALRARGAGLAASVAKVGAVMTALLFPVLLADIGTGTLLVVLVCSSLAGALLTWLLRIETAGLDLERLDAPASEQDGARSPAR